MGQPRQVRFLTAALRPAQYPPAQLPEVAFVGRSNVGKSSLINTLVGRKGLARISQTPGKTQMIHFFQVEDLFVLVDLPGYGYARVPDRVRKSWGPMVESYLGSRSTLRLVVFLLDIRRIPGGQDQQLKSWLEQKGIPVCFVVTKADKVSRGARGAQLRQIAETLGTASGEFLPFSAVTREGRPGLWRRIREAAEGRDGVPGGHGLATRT